MSDIDTSSKDLMDSENQMAARLHNVLVHIKTFMSMHSLSIATISSKPKVMEIIRKIFELNLIKR